MQNENDVAKELYAIETEIANLDDKRRKISLSMVDLQDQLTKLNHRVAGKLLPNEEYRKICLDQAVVKQKLAERRRQIDPIKSDLRRWRAMSDELRAKLFSSRTGSTHLTLPVQQQIDRRLVALRAFYLQFAEDQTRVNSMRVMAAQFASELNAILDGVEPSTLRSSGPTLTQ